ncbi:MAG: GntR family transcriptional regulator [Kiloniellaceae bacterium]
MKDQAVYDRIYEAILDHRLPPGTKLGEEALCEVFGVSRARVRKIFLRLAHGNVLELHPNRGAFVARPTPEDARHVFEARRSVENTIVRRAAERLTDAQAARLRRLVATEREARRRNDRSAMIRHSGAFHLLLSEMAGNAVLHRFLVELVSRTSLIIGMYGVPGTSNCSVEEHTALIAAIEAHDGARAAREMDAHLRHTEALLNLGAAEAAEIDLRTVFAAPVAASA